jgi:hypothetical protein
MKWAWKNDVKQHMYINGRFEYVIKVFVTPGKSETAPKPVKTKKK